MGVHEVDRLFQGVVEERRVRVEEEQVAPARDLDPLVAGCGESGVLRVRDERRGGEVEPHHLRASVGRRVVDYDGFKGRPPGGGVKDRVQAALEVLSHVVAYDDDADIQHDPP